MKSEILGVASLSSSGTDRSVLLQLYRVMQVARMVDDLESDMVRRGDAAFHIPCRGHEGIAALHFVLTPDDWIHAHYRDKALLLARGLAPEMFFHSLFCTAASHSAGRQMSEFMSHRGLHVLSAVVPVGNHALHAVGVAAAIKGRAGSPIVVCSMGDGASQQGEVLEAIAEAVRSQLPVLFIVEDNGYSISTPTRRKTFFSLPEPYDQPEVFFGLPIHRLDGRDVTRCLAPLSSVVESIRDTRSPALVVLEVDRLASHTNSDDERIYRSPEETRRASHSGDPIRNLADQLVMEGVSRQELEQIETEIGERIGTAADLARFAAEPIPVTDAKKTLPLCLTAPAGEYRGVPGEPRLTMVEAIREVLRWRMETDPRIFLLGEDIEDPKGDVFGVTRGLTRAFPGRVANSALSESTIVGVAIGRALMGERPVAFVQFADFLPLAFNQILSELGSMYWRTRGEWECPVIILAACGGYRPGLGPFHAQTLESVLAHVPGVDVFMPSHAADAAGLLNAAFDSGRPTILLYPKFCLNDRDHTTSADVGRQFVPLGKARHIRGGDDLTLVTWGTTVLLCEEVAGALEGVGVGVDLIDLRSISPWDHDAVCASASRTGKLIVVHEDNLTCGFGAEVIATVAEALNSSIVCRRIARPDTFVPCNLSNQLRLLPSFKRILTIAAELLDLGLSWDPLPRGEEDLVIIEAIGSCPADGTVSIITWEVRPGDTVRAGQRMAELESDKCSFLLTAPRDGRIETILVPEGQSVPVGTPMLSLRIARNGANPHRPANEGIAVPRLHRRHSTPPSFVTAPMRRGRLTGGVPDSSTRGQAKEISALMNSEYPMISRASAESSLPIEGPSGQKISANVGLHRFSSIGFSCVCVATGALRITNDELIANFPNRTTEDILRRTGIESRPRLASDESALTMAVAAARQALEREHLSIRDIDSLICCTTTPLQVTPSMACLILHELGRDDCPREIAAYDINAACAGYLYALTAGYDFASVNPTGRVLIVTTEAMSRVTDPTDFDTAILFGDAASATILHGPGTGTEPRVLLRRPVLTSKGEDGRILKVPSRGVGYLAMDGPKVYAEAVRQMIAMLDIACWDAGIRHQDLRLIIPHQANERIIQSIRRRLDPSSDRLYSNIRQFGNTSSSSIPSCLAEVASRCQPGDRVGLTTFGGGFTSGAAILEMSR